MTGNSRCLRCRTELTPPGRRQPLLFFHQAVGVRPEKQKRKAIPKGRYCPFPIDHWAKTTSLNVLGLGYLSAFQWLVYGPFPSPPPFPETRPRGQRFYPPEISPRLSDDCDQGLHGQIQTEPVIACTGTKKHGYQPNRVHLHGWSAADRTRR